jgi:pilus assembly protein CpaC
MIALLLPGAAGGTEANVDTHRPMTLGLGKASAIDLPEDIREVAVSDPTVVEALPRTSRQVQLIGQKIGQASVSFIARDGRPLFSLDISS